MGWGPKVPLGPGDVTKNNLPSQLPLVPGNYDHFALSYDVNQNLIQVLCYRAGQLLSTITLTYDLNQNLIDVAQT